MFWLLAVSFLVFVGGLLAVVWRRQAGSLPMSHGLIVLLVLIAGAGSYWLFGLHRDLPDWLDDVWQHETAVNALARGEITLEEAPEIPPGALARLLQRSLHQHDSAEGWFLLGQLWAQLGAGRMVELSAEQAALRDPETADYTLLWAHSLIQQADGALTDAAEQKIRQVLARYPEHEGAWIMLASSAMRAGKYQVAVESWDQLQHLHEGGEVTALLEQMREQAQQQLDVQRYYGTVTVTVEAPEVRAGGTLFVFLRQPGSVGQPMTARRIVADRFPLVVELRAEDWLQAMPEPGTPLEAGARYALGAGGIEAATHQAETQPLVGQAGQLAAKIVLQ